MQQSDLGAESQRAGSKRLRAVNRIEHPNPFRMRVGNAKLLAANAVVRKARLDHLPHRHFGKAIGFSNGTAVRFG
ncbi:hypothetical protein D9M72_512780 [compost metagenome]